MDFLCLFSMFLRNVSFSTALFSVLLNLSKVRIFELHQNLFYFALFVFFFSFFFFSRYFRFIKFFEFYVCLNSPKGNVCTSSCVLVRPRYYLSYRRLLCEQSFNGSQKSYNGEFPPQRVRLCITSVTV